MVMFLKGRIVQVPGVVGTIFDVTIKLTDGENGNFNRSPRIEKELMTQVQERQERAERIARQILDRPNFLMIIALAKRSSLGLTKDFTINCLKGKTRIWSIPLPQLKWQSFRRLL
jgi:hypothetical protein